MQTITSQWIAKMYAGKSGRDHLGLGSVSSDQILTDLLLPYSRLPILWRSFVSILKAALNMAIIFFPAVNTLVSKMKTHGILREFTGNRRNRRFRYADYIALFADPVPEFEETAQ